jgi:hypothetical protein
MTLESDVTAFDRVQKRCIEKRYRSLLVTEEITALR